MIDTHVNNRVQTYRYRAVVLSMRYLRYETGFTDKKVKAAWLLTKEGKVGLSPVAGRDGETLGFGLSPQYRDLYFSLMMPVYGFEY